MGLLKKALNLSGEKTAPLNSGLLNKALQFKSNSSGTQASAPLPAETEDSKKKLSCDTVLSVDTSISSFLSSGTEKQLTSIQLPERAVTYLRHLETGKEKILVLEIQLTFLKLFPDLFDKSFKLISAFFSDRAYLSEKDSEKF